MDDRVHQPRRYAGSATVQIESSRQLGNTDIWSVEREGEGSGPDVWGPAENLGALINTASADMCPVLPPDGETMAWFSSRPDNNWGDADIFWAYRKEP